MGIKHRADGGFRKFSASKQAFYRWTSSQLRNALGFIPDTVVRHEESQHTNSTFGFCQHKYLGLKYQKSCFKPVQEKNNNDKTAKYWINIYRR